MRAIEDLNDSNVIKNDDIIVTVDVSGLYTNIDQDSGIKACKEVLEASDNSDDLNCFILELLELVLKNNIFEFASMLFRQNIGTAMGCKPAPDYANIFMSQRIDPRITEIANSLEDPNLLKFFKRFLDDLFLIFGGSYKQLHDFFDQYNKIDTNIQFTIQHSTKNGEVCEFCNSSGEMVPFLDTQCKIVNEKIIVDLYRKSTDRNMYLLTSSCHPNSVTKNIPFSLALRIVRICSETETRDQRLSELREMLLNRDYRPGIVDAAINKAKAIPRSEALKRVVRPKTSERPVFVVKYDPRLPSVTQIVQKHWRSMVTNPQMAEVFLLHLSLPTPDPRP